MKGKELKKLLATALTITVVTSAVSPSIASANVPEPGITNERTGESEVVDHDETEETPVTEESVVPEAGSENTPEIGADNQQKNPEETEHIQAESYPTAEETQETDEIATAPEEEIVQADETGTITNEELIKSQQIIHMPEIEQDFRFRTVAKIYGFATTDTFILEEMTEDSREIGALQSGGLCYILQNQNNGWLYVESGSVRGFIKTEMLETGEEAQHLLSEYQAQAKEKALEENSDYAGIEDLATLAEELVSREENQAFLYTHTTVYRTVVDKEYGLTNADTLNIREGKGANTRIVGTLTRQSLSYILDDQDQEWIFIESGDVRGFVNRAYIDFDEDVTKEVINKGEDSFEVAKTIIELKDNSACYYTLTSIKDGVPEGKAGKAVLDFASQFIGNPYVWGGVSLTEGADCSGFVLSIYKEFGYNLPRVAEAQAQYGTKIPVEDAQPGDLVFYAKNGYIDHVIIYAGNGKTIEAMGSKYGIVQGDLNTTRAVWATRILTDTDIQYESSDINEENGTDHIKGENLGNFKVSYFCSSDLCSDLANANASEETPMVEEYTIATDPEVIPYGTKIMVNGHIYTAADTGRIVKGKEVAIYLNDHTKEKIIGENQVDVYLTK